MRLLIRLCGGADWVSAVVRGGIIALMSVMQVAADPMHEVARGASARSPFSSDWLALRLATLVRGIEIADNVYSGLFEPQLGGLISAVVNAASNGADYVMMFRDYHHAWEGNGLVRLDQGPNLFWVPVQSRWDHSRIKRGSLAPLPLPKHGTAHAPAAEVERVWHVIGEELDPSLAGGFYADDCREPNHGMFTFVLVRRGGRVSVYVWRQCEWSMPFRLPKMMFELFREDRPWIQASQDRPPVKYRRPLLED